MTHAQSTDAAIEPVPIAIEPPEGYWRREASHFPQPLTPLTSSFMLPVSRQSFERMFADYGALVDGLDFREIGGWVYNRQVPMGGKDRKPPPGWLMWIAIRTAPALRARVRKNVEAVRKDYNWLEIERWNREGRARQQREIERLRAIDLPSLDYAGFVAAFDETLEFAASSAELHYRLTAPAVLLAELVFTCEELLGWDEQRTLSLLRGLSSMSTEPARRLASLAAMAATSPGVRAVLDRPEPTLAEVHAADTGFATAFEEYQREFGLRALRYELADPALIEVPQVTLALIRDQLARRYDPEAESRAAEKAREEDLAAARESLADRPATERERFECAFERAKAYYPTREDNEFFTISAPLALLRFVALEAGRRLKERGALDRVEDVFFLEFDELRSANAGGAVSATAILRRKGERAWALKNPGPPSFGRDPGPPPSLAPLPRETRETMRALFWFAEKVFAEDASARRQENATTLKGIPASPGAYTGPARIIMGEDEFGRLQAGDVLVCPITSPVWSVLFPSVGALVTDSGGILSHPAIISREYGIPAIVATGNATAVLRDGQQVTVDGTAGTITVLA